MKKIICINIIILTLPLLVSGQRNEIVKGRSNVKSLIFTNANSNLIKIKKINSDINIDSLYFVDINGNELLEYGEEGKLMCVISNNSNDTIKELNLNINIDEKITKLFYSSKNIIEQINPKDIFEIEIPIKNLNSEDKVDSLLNVSVNIIEGKLLLSSKEMILDICKKSKELIEITYDISLKGDSLTNEDQQSDKNVILDLAISNNGDSPIFYVNGKIKLLYTGGFIVSNNEEYNYKFINPGEMKKIKLNLVITSSYLKPKYPIIFEVTGNENLYKHSERIDIEL